MKILTKFPGKSIHSSDNSNSKTIHRGLSTITMEDIEPFILVRSSEQVSTRTTYKQIKYFLKQHNDHHKDDTQNGNVLGKIPEDLLEKLNIISSALKTEINKTPRSSVECVIKSEPETVVEGKDKKRKRKDSITSEKKKKSKKSV